MMEHIVLDLYHTCKNDKLAPNSDITPFKARSNGKQWLGHGYYFWVESLFFAQSWGKNSDAFASTGYAVLRYRLTISRDNLLDLVGSPADQQGILKAFELFKNGEIENARSSTLAAYINWIQENNAWHWQATKLADYGKKESFEKHSVKISTKGELTFLKPRIQLCVHKLSNNVDLKFQEIITTGFSKKKKFSSYTQVK